FGFPSVTLLYTGLISLLLDIEMQGLDSRIISPSDLHLSEHDTIQEGRKHHQPPTHGEAINSDGRTPACPD
ncbi:MAG: hypothetical protein Q9M23_06410, partial [Mariprofundaceae bacterium]|nr:hypothetical protein [Mariprofundaceae bacterium]